MRVDLATLWSGVTGLAFASERNRAGDGEPPANRVQSTLIPPPRCAAGRSGSPGEGRQAGTRNARGGAEATRRLAATCGDPRAALAAGVGTAATEHIDDFPPGKVRLRRRDRAHGAPCHPGWARRFRRCNPMACDVQRQCDDDGSQHRSSPHRTPTRCLEADTMCRESGINWAASIPDAGALLAHAGAAVQAAASPGKGRDAPLAGQTSRCHHLKTSPNRDAWPLPRRRCAQWRRAWRRWKRRETSRYWA